MFTNFGAQSVAWALGSVISNNYIQAFAIGSGSGTALSTNVTLANESGVRVSLTGSPDFSSARKVTFQGDYNATQISGLLMTEFGLFNTTTQNSGSIWQREAFNAVTFDGTNELQLITTLEVVPS